MSAETPHDLATVHALRSDLALQISRCIERWGQSQSAAARRLEIPQPTLSKIMNGRVVDLSLELLIRIAVRAGLPVVLQTGKEPCEAGVYVTRPVSPETGTTQSKLAANAREQLLENMRRMTAQERLEAQLRHTELVTALHQVGKRGSVR